MQFESYLARVWGGLDNSVDKTNTFTSLLLTIFITGIFFFFISFFISDFTSTILFKSSDYSTSFVLIFVNALLVSLLGLPLMVLRMERRIKSFLLINITQSSGYCMLIYWLYIHQNISINYVIYSLLVSTTLGFFISLFIVRKYFSLCYEISILKPALRFGLPLIPAVLIYWINSQVDRYALLFFFDMSIVGEFIVLCKVTAFVSMAVMVFRQAWLPYAYNLAKNKDFGAPQFNHVLFLYLLVGLTTSLVIVYFSDSIFQFIAPPEYHINSTILPILLLGVIVYGSSTIVNIGMMVSGKTEWNSYASFIGLFLNIFLTIILIPMFGIHGAAWGTLLSSLSFILILSWRSKRELGINFLNFRLLVLISSYLLISKLLI